MKDCQLAVLIVGKRYGSLSDDGRSVTHNEFLTAREHTIPVVCLVEREVLSFKKVFDATDDGQPQPSFPGMDWPSQTFSLIQEIMDAPVNNGVVAFDSVADARTLIKSQLAHIFCALLRSRFDPVKSSINDVLSEIMTLRQELKDEIRGDFDSRAFLRAARFLVDEANRNFRKLVVSVCRSVEEAVPLLLQCKTLDDFLAAAQLVCRVVTETSPRPTLCGTWYGCLVDEGSSDASRRLRHPATWHITNDGEAIFNENAKSYFDAVYERFRKVVRA